MWSAAGGYYEICALLIHANAILSKNKVVVLCHPPNFPPQDGWTPLSLACKREDINLITLFRSSKNIKNVDQVDSDHDEEMEYEDLNREYETSQSSTSSIDRGGDDDSVDEVC